MLAALHLFAHIIVPGLAARLFWKKRRFQTYLWMLTGLAIDLDHLLAAPIYDSNRCSIGFHPLHTWPAALIYLGLCAPRATRAFGVGLVIHLALDAIDCFMRSG